MIGVCLRVEGGGLRGSTLLRWNRRRLLWLLETECRRHPRIRLIRLRFDDSSTRRQVRTFLPYFILSFYIRRSTFTSLCSCMVICSLMLERREFAGSSLTHCAVKYGPGQAAHALLHVTKQYLIWGIKGLRQGDEHPRLWPYGLAPLLKYLPF